MDQLLWSVFTKDTQSTLRQHREEALVVYNRMPADNKMKAVWLQLVRLYTYAHNLDLEKYNASLAKLKALAYEVMEAYEANIERGVQSATIVHVPSDGHEPLSHAGTVDEGSYLSIANGFKRTIELFENRVGDVETLAGVKHRLATGAAPPPLDYSAYQNPAPGSCLTKGEGC